MDWYIYRKPRFLLSSTGVVCELLSWIPCPTVGSHVKSLGKSTSIPNQRIISNMPSISIFIVYWAKPRDCWFINLHPYKSPYMKLSHLFLVLPPPLFMAQSPPVPRFPTLLLLCPPFVSQHISLNPPKTRLLINFYAESQTCGNCPIYSWLYTLYPQFLMVPSFPLCFPVSPGQNPQLYRTIAPRGARPHARQAHGIIRGGVLDGAHQMVGLWHG